jgi:hypothetical protein
MGTRVDRSETVSASTTSATTIAATTPRLVLGWLLIVGVDEDELEFACAQLDEV